MIWSASTCFARELPWFVAPCVIHINSNAHLYDQVGRLPLSGNGVPARSRQAVCVQQLSENKHDNNLELLERIKEDVHSKALMQACEDDALLGRMSLPRVLQMDDVELVHLSPRFGVAQGSVACYVWSISELARTLPGTH